MKALIVIYVFVFFLGCNFQEEISFSGKFLFTSGSNRITSFDASTKKKNELISTKGLVTRLTKLSDHEILYSVNLLSEPAYIYSYSIKSNLSERLIKGYAPTFMKEHNKLFYYREDIDGHYLNCSDFDSLSKSKRICGRMFSNSGSNSLRDNPVLQISRNEVIFLDELGFLTIYDVLNKTQKKTKFQKMYPFTFREKSQELFCWKWDYSGYVIVNLVTMQLNDFPIDDVNVKMIYLKEKDALIYPKYKKWSFSEVQDLYYYSFANKKEYLLIEETGLRDAIFY